MRTTAIYEMRLGASRFYTCRVFMRRLFIYPYLCGAYVHIHIYMLRAESSLFGRVYFCCAPAENDARGAYFHLCLCEGAN